MHASSALFDAVVSSERPAREQLTPQPQESKAVAAGTLPMLSQPPRFFTPREVARLQVRRHSRLQPIDAEPPR